MNCYVYKGAKKDDYYLFLPDEFEESAPPAALPEVILQLLGELSLVVEVELTADRKLPQADVSQVIGDIQSQGFYLQMPKKDMRAEEAQYFN
ncbi:YcgL domain-containing protein [Arenicella xantha]|uniref:YcgL domain-containing protein n=1 Tax=Arenicella xantha TaxID=644221 RepID=A0A395JPW5_9GAMM|nr:YcgL domain-containing protein [Arenicella xantha]RBP52675.1 hypothetical protein DFR28_10157 [Arenicella xantha]